MRRHILTAALALLLAGDGIAQFTVTGTFEYEDKGWGYNGWTGADGSRPIRRADVTVIDDVTSANLGTGTTDDNGDFSIVASSAGTTDIIVRVNCDTNNAGSFQRIRVTTETNVEYTGFSPVFGSHDTSNDLDIGTVTVLKITSGGDEANAFNMLDMGVESWEYITGPLVNESATGTTIRIYWPSGRGSFASGNQAHIGDDDGYDDAVILHEIGHVVHNEYSDSDSPGGSHFFGDSDQNPLLSMGEGYATFFAGCIFDKEIVRQAIYMDANGSSQTGGVGLRARIETVAPYAGDSRGAADELAVAATLFDIIDTENSPDQSAGSDDDNLISTTLINGLSPDEAWWDTFVGPVATALNLNANHAWDGWFSEHGTGGQHSDMVALFALRRLDFDLDTDEPNDTLSTGVPTPAFGSWSGDRTLYKSAANPPVPGTADKDFYDMDLVIGSQIDIETRYPGGAADADTQCDTELGLWDPQDVKQGADEASGTGRNAAINNFLVTETGEWTIRVQTTSSIRRYGRYNLRVSYDFENFRPTIDTGPTASPSTIDDDETSTLSATASDSNGGQTLSYAWTPQSGGTITGSGSSVTFTPPAVVVQTDFDVELIVSDNLGAESDPEIVTITVAPSGDVCGNAPSVVTGGTGKAGSLGIPVLTTVNLPAVPSTDFALDLSNLLPAAQGWLIIGVTLISAPFDLGTMHPSPDIIVPLPTGAGAFQVPLPLGSDPALCGGSLFWQFMVTGDPGAIGAKQTSQTVYVETIFGS